MVIEVDNDNVVTMLLLMLPLASLLPERHRPALNILSPFGALVS